MSEHLALILHTVERFLAGVPAVRADAAAFDHAGWQQAVEIGLPLLLVDEAHGGLGLGWREAAEILQALGAAALPLPLAEHLLAAHALSVHGQAPPAGVLTLAARAGGALQGTRYSGELSAVPFGRHADQVLAQLPPERGGALIVLRTADAAECRLAAGIAGEACDGLRFHAAPARVLAQPAEGWLFERAALLRCCQAAGALHAALQLTLDYARTRRQFGRPIGQFQAVQQQLAQFGAEAAAVACAAGAACRAMDAGESGFAVGAAKLRANQAIGLGTSIAHQVHAAIGFTREYPLHRWTQRLWQWRSEFGNDRYWSERLGAQVAARGAESFWPDLTARDDRAAGTLR